MGKMTVVKTLALPQVVHLLRVLPISQKQLKDLEKIFTNFIWGDKPALVKKDVIIQSTENGGLNFTDIVSFSKALKIVWIKKLLSYQDRSDWKFVFFYLSKNVGQNSLWYQDRPSLLKIAKQIKNVFWKELISNWAELNYTPVSISDILYMPLLHNGNIPIKKSPKYYASLVSNEICFVHDILNQNSGQFLEFPEFKKRFNVDLHFIHYNGLLQSIPKVWKTKINNEYDITALTEEPQHIELLNSKEKTSKIFYKKYLGIYLDKLTDEQNTPTAVRKWNNLDWFNLKENWNIIFSLPFSTTKGTKLREFQYFINHNVLYTNSKLFKIKKITSENCTFCHSKPETIEHLLFFCEKSKAIWNNFLNILNSSTIYNIQCEPNVLLFGYFDNSDNNSAVSNSALNLVLLLVKRFIYVSRCKDNLPTIEGLLKFLNYHIKIDYQSVKSPNKKWYSFKNCQFFPYKD